jgi:hypothetical protein
MFTFVGKNEEPEGIRLEVDCVSLVAVKGWSRCQVVLKDSIPSAPEIDRRL